METKKNLNDNEVTKVTGGANVEYEIVGIPYQLVCPVCYNVLANKEWKSLGPINVNPDDEYCPTCKCKVRPIVNKLYQ